MNFSYKLLASCVLAVSTGLLPFGQAGAQGAQSAIVNLEGGGVQHVQSGLQCPATLAYFQYDSSKVVSEATSDILCEYNGHDRGQQLSYYIIKPIEGVDEQDLAIRLARGFIADDASLELDNDASRERQVGVGTAMLKLGQVSGEGVAPPCIVLKRAERAQLVTTWTHENWGVSRLSPVRIRASRMRRRLSLRFLTKEPGRPRLKRDQKARLRLNAKA